MSVPLLIADGDIPTTRLLAHELRAVHREVEIRIPETLFGTSFDHRSIVFSRLCHPSYGWLPEYLARRGLPYAYFLDDNFWELTPAIDPIVAPFFNHPAALATLARFVRGATIVILWSARLRAYVAERFPEVRAVHVAPGIDIKAIDTLRPGTGRSADGAIRVGYPTSRRPGVAPLLTALVRHAGARYGAAVQFEFVGWMPDELAGMANVTLTPQIEDYDRYIAFVLGRHWDIGLAPLVGARFETFKTDIKYREYGAFGVPGIYSDTPPYAEAVRPGKTGLLAADTPEAWIAALDALVASRALRRAIAEAASRDVREHRDLARTGRDLAARLPAPPAASAT